MLPTIAVGMIVFAANCSEPMNPNDLPRIELTAENVISKEVWLRVKFININEPREFVLERDGKQIAVGRIQKADTLVIDTTALPKRVYSYKAIRLEGSARTLESDALQVMTLDTTSHQVQWQVDTLGVRGTIFDVWAFSRDQIWAVGEIYVRDATGKEDPVKYNVARWNGQKWELARVMFPICNAQGVEVGLGPFEVRALYAFSPNNIWLTDQASLVQWDGETYRRFCTPAGTRQGSINKLWGINGKLFMVGTNGSITLYDGSTWRKMESGTTVDLEDVWGIDDKHAWATGTSTREGRSVLLAFNGSSWSIIYDTVSQPRELQFGLSSVWTNNSNVLYLTGSSGVRILETHENLFRKPTALQKYVSYRVRALSQNDVFVGGAGGEVLHFNGSDWHLYPELKTQGSFAFWYCVASTREMVLVGGTLFTELFGMPVVVRGTR